MIVFETGFRRRRGGLSPLPYPKIRHWSARAVPSSRIFAKVFGFQEFSRAERVCVAQSDSHRHPHWIQNPSRHGINTSSSPGSSVLYHDKLKGVGGHTPG